MHAEKLSWQYLIIYRNISLNIQKSPTGMFEMVHRVTAPEDPDILAPTEEGWKETTPCVLVVYKQDSPMKVQASNAITQRKTKRVARFWKAPCISTSLQSSKRKHQIN
jgi:hypothetical protein